jgi:hypothetical protein
VDVNVYQTSGWLPPPWQPTDPCQLSPAPTVVPLLHVPLGVIVVAVLQLSFAGWAKIKATENNKKPSVNNFFKLKKVSKIIFSISQELHF